MFVACLCVLGQSDASLRAQCNSHRDCRVAGAVCNKAYRFCDSGTCMCAFHRAAKYTFDDSTLQFSVACSVTSHVGDACDEGEYCVGGATCDERVGRCACPTRCPHCLSA